MKTVALLACSNIFMTFAWYWHLREKNAVLWLTILASWGIAFFEYCLLVPANRIAYAGGWSGFQLKVAQEIITLVVFTGFALWYLREPWHWKYFASFLCLLGAAWFAFMK